MADETTIQELIKLFSTTTDGEWVSWPGLTVDDEDDGGFVNDEAGNALPMKVKIRPAYIEVVSKIKRRGGINVTDYEMTKALVRELVEDVALLVNGEWVSAKLDMKQLGVVRSWIANRAKMVEWLVEESIRLANESLRLKGESLGN